MTSIHVRTFGFIFILFSYGISFAQVEKHSTINKDNYYDYFLPKEKVLYLSEGEIKIILVSELRRQGFTFLNYNCIFINDTTKSKGKLLLWLSVKSNTTGIFLDEKISRPSINDRTVQAIKIGGFKCNVFSDPIDYSFFTFRQNCYWYQENKKNQRSNLLAELLLLKF